MKAKHRGQVLHGWPLSSVATAAEKQSVMVVLLRWLKGPWKWLRPPIHKSIDHITAKAAAKRRAAFPGHPSPEAGPISSAKPTGRCTPKLYQLQKKGRNDHCEENRRERHGK
jgi:hypothetical protein